VSLVEVAGCGGRRLPRPNAYVTLSFTRFLDAFSADVSALLGTLGAEVPDLTERGAKKRGGETSRPGTQVAIVSPDRLDGAYQFPAALIDCITDTVHYVKRNLSYGSTPPPAHPEPVEGLLVH